MDGELFTFKFKVTRFGMFFGVGALITLGFWLYPDERPTFTFGGAALATAAALHNAYLARKTFEVSIREKKLALASEFFWRFYGPSGKEARKQFLLVGRELKGKNSAEIVQALQADNAKAEAIYEVLNMWEEVGYAAREGRVDAKMVKSLMGSALLRSARIAGPWLQEYRRGEDHPTAWEHFDWLCEEFKRLQKSGQ